MPTRLGEIVFPAREAPGFSDLIRRLSDPGPGPHADNFITNEDSFPRVSGRIARDSPASAVYLGVGPDQNFTYVAHARSSHAFLVDFRRRNLVLHLLHKALFRLSTDRFSYVSLLTARRPPPLGREAPAADLVQAFAAAPFDRALLADAQARVREIVATIGVLDPAELEDLRTIHARLAGPGMNARFLALPAYPTFGRLIQTPDRDGRPSHLLATEELFGRVRRLQSLDAIIPVVGDLSGDGAMPRLATWLREQDLRLGVLYTSDAEFFLLRDSKLPAFARNLSAFPLAPGAFLIRSTTRQISHPSRIPGDHGTTVVEPCSTFLDRALSGRLVTQDDLFDPAFTAPAP